MQGHRIDADTLQFIKTADVFAFMVYLWGGLMLYGGMQ